MATKKPKKLTVEVNRSHWDDPDFDETHLKLECDSTDRGFSYGKFDDLYGQKCSIQASSLATQGAIWFGVDNTGPRLEGLSGKRNEEVGARMHLSRRMVEQMLPMLHRFVETGYFNTDAMIEDSCIKES
jgi:hypothetical protein